MKHKRSKILHLKNLSISFGALKVADGLNLTVYKGQALGIIGPNGAGKTTLFNLITGALSVETGEIWLGPVNITKHPQCKRCLKGIGRAYQVPLPFENLTVFENLLVAATAGRDCYEHQVSDDCAAILEKTGLYDKANQLAGGLRLLDRKRLELARALATKPKLLLLDEIAGGLTEGECNELVELIKNIHQSGMTIVWIEHVVHALFAVVDDLIVLNFGQKIAEGSPQDVFHSAPVQEIYMGISV